MKKIAFYLPDLELGGVQKRTLRLIKGLSESNKFQIDLIVNVSAGALLESVPSEIQVISLDSNKLKIFEALSKLRDNIVKGEYKIVICCMGQDFLRARFAVSSLSKSFVPFICIIQAVPVVLPEESFIKNLIRRSAISLFYPLAHKIICVSADVRDSLIELNSKLSCNSLVIYNPVVAEYIEQLAKHSVTHKFLSSENKVIIAVGRVHFQKDYPTLVEAFNYAYQKDRSLRLIVVGGGDIEELTKLIESYGQDVSSAIDLIGEVSNPFPYVIRSNLYVMSSRWEGLPSALIEAMYLGVPVISTDCRSGPREILLDGELGSLVEVGDWYALGEKILSEIKHKSSSSSVLLRERACQFSVQSAVDQYCKLFDQI